MIPLVVASVGFEFLQGENEARQGCLQQLKWPDFSHGMCRFRVAEKREKRAGS